MQWIRYAGVSRKLFRPLCSLPGLGRGFFLVRGRRGAETAGRIGTELTDSRRLVQQNTKIQYELRVKRTKLTCVYLDIRLQQHYFIARGSTKISELLLLVYDNPDNFRNKITRLPGNVGIYIRACSSWSGTKSEAELSRFML